MLFDRWDSSRTLIRGTIGAIRPWLIAVGPLLGVAGGANAQAPSAQPQASIQLVQQAAQALGGEQRIREVRNITLSGYGQFLWQDLEISNEPNAPQKYEQLTDLTRVYDLANDRFQARHRSFLLAPLLFANAYNFSLADKRLDGDIAYDMSAGLFTGFGPPGPTRVSAIGSGLFFEGAHTRRMWMQNNPVALVRNLLDSATILSVPRLEEDKYITLEVKLKQGDSLSVGFFAASSDCQSTCAYLPAFVRWSAPSPNLGEAFFTTWFTGYGSFEGLLMPLAYNTRLSYRNVEWLKIWADHYDINSDIPDLTAPEAIRNAPVPPEYASQPLTAEKVADRIWRIAPYGTTVIEFEDHMTLFELNTPGENSKRIIELARTLGRGKPVTQLIVSHHHFDHSFGVRQAVAEGLTIISRRGNRQQFEEMISHPAPNYPDDLARSPKPLNFIPVDEKLVLSDPTMTLWVLWTRNNTHMADAVVAYAPKQKVMMEGDVATAAYIWQFWPDNFRDIIDYYKLDVEMVSEVHAVDPNDRGALTFKQVDDLLRVGTERARKMCADELARGTYLAGCPVRSKRY